MRTMIFLLIVGLSFCAGMAIQGAKTKAGANQRARVTGVGGIFIKADNPAKLTAWYEKHLGIKRREGAQPGEPPMFLWRDKDHPEAIGVTVWALFPKDSQSFSHTRSPFIINYRVDNLDRMLQQLHDSGVQVGPQITDDFNGRFNWALDPEGNRIELWEPKEGF